MAVTVQKLVPTRLVAHLKQRIGIASLVLGEFVESMRLVGRGFCRLMGLDWCPYYACILHGGPEANVGTADLCPICLRKLHWAIGFDIMVRYQQLQQMYDNVPEQQQQSQMCCLGCRNWVATRIELLTARCVGPTSIAHLMVP